MAVFGTVVLFLIIVWCIVALIKLLPFGGNDE